MKRLLALLAVLALVVAGWAYGLEAEHIREVSVNSPVGVPVWQLKFLIPFGAALLAIQGVAEILRCAMCLRDGKWPQRLHDVEELESIVKAQQRAQAKEGKAQ